MAASNSASKFRAPVVVAGISLLTFIVALGMLYAVGSRSRRGRQAEVNQLGKGRALDPARTKHIFQLMVDGGLQTVMVIDAMDERQIALVQEYLNTVAERFQKGDFSDAMGVGGEDIPGVAELKAGAQQMTIRYYALSNGGQIRYISANPQLVNATHRWLMAQLSAEGKLDAGR